MNTIYFSGFSSKCAFGRLPICFDFQKHAQMHEKERTNKQQRHPKGDKENSCLWADCLTSVLNLLHCVFLNNSFTCKRGREGEKK